MADKHTQTTIALNKSKHNYTLYVLAFIIPIIASLIGLYYGGFAPFGSNDVITSSGNASTINYIFELWHKYHNGTTFSYSLKSGLGYDFSSVIAYYLSDPLDLLVLLFPETNVLNVLDILYVLKLGFAGLFFAIFLNYHDTKISYIKNISDNKSSKRSNLNFKIGKSDAATSSIGLFLEGISPAKLGFSLAYALSGYMLSYGLNVTFLSAVALLPLIILGFEKMVYEKKPLIYILSLTVSFYCNFQLSLITFVFCILYCILYNYSNAENRLHSFILKFISDIIVTGLSFPILYTCFSSTFFRKEHSLHFPNLIRLTSFFDVIKMMLTSSNSSILQRFGSGIDIYCGIFVLSLVLCFFFNGRISYWEKIRKGIILLVLISSTFISTPNYIMNIFTESDKKVSLFGYAVVFYLLVISFESFKALGGTKTITVIISGALSLTLIVLSLLFCVGYDSVNSFVTSLEFTILYMIVLLLWKENSLVDYLKQISFGCIIIFEIIFSFMHGLSSFSEYNGQYYSSESYFYSAVEDYIHAKDPNARILVYTFNKNDSTPLSNAILGYTYVITASGTTPMDSNLEFVSTVYDIDIYKNNDAVNNGVFIDSSITDNKFNYSYPLSTTNIIAKSIALSDINIFRPVAGTFNVEEVSQLIDSNIDYKNYLRNTMNHFSYTIEESGDLYSNLSHIIHVGNVEKNAPYTINYVTTYSDAKREVLGCELALYDSSAYKEFLNKLTKNNASMNIGNTTEINIEIDAPDDGYILLPVENYKKWNISSSNIKTTSFDFFTEQLTLVPVSKGNNNITLTYDNNSLYICIPIMILSLLIMLILLYRINKLYETGSKKSIKIFDGILSFTHNNRVYLYTIILATIAFITLLIINKCIPFGSNSFILSDGFYQNYPEWTKLVNDLKTGNYSTLDYSLGFISGGRSALSWMFFLYPVRLVLLLFPEKYSLFGFTFMYYISFILSGISIIFYLTNRPNGTKLEKKDLKLIPIALAYNLSAYIACYISFSGFIDLCVLVPLMILTMENLIYKKKCTGYILLLSYFMIISYYMAFLLCEFLFLYFFVSHFDNFKDFIYKGIRFGLSSICAAGLAAFTLLPSFTSVQTLNYSTNDVEVKPAFSLTNTLITSFEDLQFLPRVHTVTRDDSQANTYCGLLVLLFLAIYITNSKVKLSIRIRKCLLIFFLFFAYGNPLLNYILHGFHKQTMVPNRFSIFVIFLMITIFYDCIIHYREIYKKSSIVSLFAFTGMVITAFIINNHNEILTLSYILSIIFCSVYAIYYIAQFLSKRKNETKKFILTLFTIELLFSYLYMGHTIGSLHVDFMLDNIENIKALSATHQLKEEALLRTEVSGSEMYNNTLLSDINSISIFTSTLSSNTTAMLKQWNLRDGINTIHYDTGNPLGNIMLNVRYFIKDIYRQDSYIPSYMDKIDSKANISLYNDWSTVGSGIFIPDTQDINLFDPSKYDNCFDYQNAITQKLINQDLYDKITLTTDINKITDQSSYVMMKDDENGYESETRIYTGTDISGEIYLSFNGIIYSLGTAVEGDVDLFEMDLFMDLKGNFDNTVYIAKLNLETLKELSNYLTSLKSQDLIVNDNNITGTINTISSGTVYIPLPYDSTWNAYVDDHEVSLKPYLSGLGIHVDAGNHSIKLSYEPSHNYTGYLISLVFVIILIITYIFKIKVEKQKTIV